MPELDLYQVDAFADRLFAGNPAAVIPLRDWLPDEALQAIAVENNLSETAYFIRQGDGRYHLRWFTPGYEVSLCGHATLASAHILYTELGEEVDALKFETLSGELTVARDGADYVMDFPADPPVETVAPVNLAAALGAAPAAVLRGQYLLAVYDDETTLRGLNPDMHELITLSRPENGVGDSVIVTAPGEGEYDFVSRFFAPTAGIPEDPVTGSAHCTLAPYWAERLGKDALNAFQASARGGFVGCRVAGDRVELTGAAVTYLRGRIVV